ncbi:DUF6414 family protein [Clostridium isatidis]|uniref:Uncharacterized protein n=2 Tax=Eubacteriales TaxID=186802 RepID=A0A343JF81_9CLOT|nr:hypothetical protein [Clostridium isatidis]ASW44189.1 hypothetical protein BEN51_12195 [Clostridium isatidis]
MSLLSPIYLNQDMIQDISSILINGYFESITIRKVNDNTYTGKYQNNNKGQHSEDYKNTKGDKDDSTTIGKSCYNYEDSLKYLESKNYDRNDITIKRAYSTFLYYNILKRAMIDLNLIKNLNNNQASIDDIFNGDYVEFNGSLKINSLSNTIDNCILILTNYDPSSLDKQFNNSNLGPLTYTSILELLKSMQKLLIKGNTLEVLVKSNSFSSILSLNTNYTSKFSYIYDLEACNCTVFGKVASVIKSSKENISELRKTGLTEYYKSLLNSFKPYFKVLNDNGFSIPREFITEIYGPALEIVPISICI